MKASLQLQPMYCSRDYNYSSRYSRMLPYFGSSSYLYQRMPIGLNISPSIWQSYINAILDCLQSKKYCKVIMDNLLLFTPSKEAHMNKLEDLLRALLKNGLKISPKKCQLLKPAYSTWEMKYSLKIRKYV